MPIGTSAWNFSWLSTEDDRLCFFVHIGTWVDLACFGRMRYFNSDGEIDFGIQPAVKAYEGDHYDHLYDADYSIVWIHHRRSSRSPCPPEDDLNHRRNYPLDYLRYQREITEDRLEGLEASKIALQQPSNKKASKYRDKSGRPCWITIYFRELFNFCYLGTFAGGVKTCMKIDEQFTAADDCKEVSPEGEIYFGAVLDDNGNPFLRVRFETRLFNDEGDKEFQPMEIVAKCIVKDSNSLSSLSKNEKLRLGFHMQADGSFYKPTEFHRDTTTPAQANRIAELVRNIVVQGREDDLDKILEALDEAHEDDSLEYCAKKADFLTFLGTEARRKLKRKWHTFGLQQGLARKRWRDDGQGETSTNSNNPSRSHSSHIVATSDSDAPCRRDRELPESQPQVDQTRSKGGTGPRGSCPARVIRQIVVAAPELNTPVSDTTPCRNESVMSEKVGEGENGKTALNVGSKHRHLTAPTKSGDSTRSQVLETGSSTLAKSSISTKPQSVSQAQPQNPSKSGASTRSHASEAASTEADDLDVDNSSMEESQDHCQVEGYRTNAEPIELTDSTSDEEYEVPTSPVKRPRTALRGTRRTARRGLRENIFSD